MANRHHHLRLPHPKCFRHPLLLPPPQSEPQPPLETTLPQEPVSSPAASTAIEAASEYGWIHEGEVLNGVVDASVITLPDGTYRMYYGSWRDWPVGQHQRDPYIGYAASKDGREWIVEGETGIAGGWPRVIRLQDDRLRMYYGGYPGIAAAVSLDGIVWQNEILTGFQPSEMGKREYGGLDVVTLADGTYRMYYSETVPSSQFTVTGESPIKSAVSKDGLDWQLEPEARIDPLDGNEGPMALHPRVISRPDGSYQMFYGIADNTIWWAISRDGLTWSDRKPERVFGADAEIVRLPDDGMRLFVNWLDSTFSTGRERQGMWSYVWGRLPFSLTAPSKVSMRPGQSASATLKIDGFPGERISFDITVYSFSVYRPEDPSSPFRVEMDSFQGTVPFSTKITFTHQTNEPWATLVITGSNGSQTVCTTINARTSLDRAVP